jgi:hypothetical protein
MNSRICLSRRLVPVVLLLVTGLACAGGQSEAAPRGGVPAVHPPAGPDAPGALPLSRVVLFTSGVGYFQRDGEVEGDETVELSFKTAQINDLLKSMVVRDFDGGQVAGVNYASRDPLSRTLRSFGIDLTEHPSLAQILAQVRGEPVELFAPSRVAGKVVGVESGTDEKGLPATWLNLLGEQGLRSVNLAQVQTLRLLDPALQAELEQALALLADSRSAEKKRVSVLFTGQGRRRVQVGYLLEAPLWKTSYRLVLGEKDRHYLQGWAIVENTTEEDWRAVRLSLISGRPISFTMDLYRPLYVPRPQVQMELYSSLVPQTYEGDLGAPQAAPAEMAEEMEAPMAKSEMRQAAPAPSRAKASAGGAGAYRDEDTLDLSRGVAAAAQAGEAGSFFQYAIEQPVSIPRQESAMIPIVGQEIEGKRVSIYNEQVHPKYPLHGLQLKNTTGLSLMAGPLTVFEAGSYAGDARIETLPPAGERLISFALDLDMEVAASARSQPDTLVSVRILRGSLFSTLKARRERVYTAKNSATRPRELLVEHPLDADWELVEPAKPEEKTRSAYRFLVPVPAGATKELLVAEERQYSQTVALTNLNPDLIAYYVSSRAVSEPAKQALRQIGARKDELARTTAARQEEERKVQRIRDEQSRIRQNMDRLNSNSDLYKRYVAQLTSQESELEKLFVRIDALVAKESEQREALEDFMAGLAIE